MGYASLNISRKARIIYSGIFSWWFIFFFSPSNRNKKKTKGSRKYITEESLLHDIEFSRQSNHTAMVHRYRRFCGIIHGTCVDLFTVRVLKCCSVRSVIRTVWLHQRLFSVLHVVMRCCVASWPPFSGFMLFIAKYFIAIKVIHDAAVDNITLVS